MKTIIWEAVKTIVRFAALLAIAYLSFLAVRWMAGELAVNHDSTRLTGVLLGIVFPLFVAVVSKSECGPLMCVAISVVAIVLAVVAICVALQTTKIALIITIAVCGLTELTLPGTWTCIWNWLVPVPELEIPLEPH
ncbi:MAG: hypothetical protein NTY04_02925 [Candidatus Staskawiczbacteria bacterium]|nr:hypothetical protein [Candidatus Staskawiczbacteria bacterium]